jgi:hypothetical protein
MTEKAVFAFDVLIYRGDDTIGFQEDTLILDEDHIGIGDITLQFGNDALATLEAITWNNLDSRFDFSDDINLGGNEIQDFKVEQLADAPACAVTDQGRVYYNTTDDSAFLCNGSDWSQIDNVLATESSKIAQTRNDGDSLAVDLNTGAVVEVPLTGVADTIDDYFQINGNGLEVLQDGRYLFTTSIYLASNAARANLDLSFYVDGVSQEVVGSSGYIRSASGHNNSSIHVSQWLELAANQVVTVRAQREGAAGVVNLSTKGSSVLSAFLPASAAAKGEKGESGADGIAGFSWLSGNVDPGLLDGINGDLYLNTLTKDLFRKIGGFWVLETNLASTSGYAMLWAEESNRLNNNQYEWSYGDSDTDIDGGLTQIRDGHIIGMSLNLPTAGGGNTQVEVVVNGVGSGSVTAPGGSRTAFTEFAVPVAFSAGDVITFRTITAGGANEGGAVAALVQYN